jgi:predicted Fe-Mo cluster-binding NifX family protein
MAIIAVGTSDGKNIDVHFGQATSFQIYDVALDGTYKHLEERTITPAVEGAEASHASATIEQLPDVDVVLVSKIGTGPTRALEGRGTRAFALSGSLDVALTAYGKKQRLFKIKEPGEVLPTQFIPGKCGGCGGGGGHGKGGGCGKITVA